MGGTDENSNLVKLSIRRHIIAHMLLAEIYPYSRGLNLSAYLMTVEWVDGAVTNKQISTRLSAYYKAMSDKLQVGKTTSNETREKLRKSNRSKDFAEKISKTLKNRGELNKTAYREVMAEGIKFPNVKACAEHYNIAHRTMIGWLKNPNKTNFYYITKKVAKKIKGPDGTVYKSIREAERKSGHGRRAIRNWLNNYPELGWKYLEDNGD